MADPNDDVVFKIGADVENIAAGLAEIQKSISDAASSFGSIKDSAVPAFELAEEVIRSMVDALGEARANVDQSSTSYEILSGLIEGLADEFQRAKAEGVAFGAAVPAAAAEAAESIKSVADSTETLADRLTAAQNAAAKSAEESSSAFTQLFETLDRASEIGETFADKLSTAALSGMDRMLEGIAQKEKEALASLGEAPKGYEDQWAESAKNIEDYFDDMRAVAEKYTGDAIRDAEMRGIKTKEVLEAEAETERKVLADMLAARERFTSQAIDLQERRLKEAEALLREEVKVTKNFFDAAFVSLVAAFTSGELAANYLTRAFDSVFSAAKNIMTAVPSMVQSLANTGDAFLTMSQQSGIAVETLSQWDFVASQTGVSLQTLSTASQQLSRRLENESSTITRSLKKIGLTAAELKRGKPEDAFMNVIDGLKGLSSETERSAVGFALFGNRFRSFAQLTKEDMRGLMTEADKLGLTMTESAARMGDAYNDAQDRLGRVFEGIKRQFGTPLLESAVTLIEGITARVRKFFSEVGVDASRFGSIAKDIIKTVLAVFDEFMTAIQPLVKVIGSLSAGAFAMLPGLIGIVADAIRFALPVIQKMAEGLAAINPESVKLIAQLTLVGGASVVAGSGMLDLTGNIATMISGVKDSITLFGSYTKTVAKAVVGFNAAKVSLGSLSLAVRGLITTIGAGSFAFGALAASVSGAVIAFAGFKFLQWAAEASGLDKVLGRILDKSYRLKELRTEVRETGSAGVASVAKELADLHAQLDRLDQRQTPARALGLLSDEEVGAIDSGTSAVRRNIQAKIDRIEKDKELMALIRIINSAERESGEQIANLAAAQAFNAEQGLGFMRELFFGVIEGVAREREARAEQVANSKAALDTMLADRQKYTDQEIDLARQSVVEQQKALTLATAAVREEIQKQSELIEENLRSATKAGQLSGRDANAERDRLAVIREAAEAYGQLSDAERRAEYQADLLAAATARLTPAQTRDARAAYDRNIAVGEAVALMTDHNLITAEQASAVGKLYEAWTKADAPLKSFIEGVKQLSVEMKTSATAGTTWTKQVERFGPSALQAVTEASFKGKAALAAIPEEVRKIAEAFRDKNIADAVKSFKLMIVTAGEQMTQALMGIGGGLSAKLSADMKAQSALLKSLANERALIGKHGLALQLEQIKQGRDAELEALKERQTEYGQFYQDAVDAATLRWQHEEDLALQTYDTIEERMRKAGVQTKAELQKSADDAKLFYEQMLKSGLATHAALYEAWKTQRKLIAEAAGKDGLGKFQAGLQGTIELFRTLSQTSADTFNSIAAGIGSALASVSQMSAGIQGIKDGLAAMRVTKDGKKVFSIEGITEMLGGITSVAGAIAQAVDLALALGKALKDAFSRSEAEKAASDIRRNFTGASGVTEASAVAVEAERLVKDLRIDRNLALDLLLPEILKEAGGLNARNYQQFRDRAGELFQDVKIHGEVGERAMRALDTMMGELAKHVVEQGGLWDEHFIGMMREAQAEGLELAAVMDLVRGQLDIVTAATGKVAAGLTATLSQAVSELTDMTQEEYESAKEASDLLTALDKERAKFMGPDRRLMTGDEERAVEALDESLEHYKETAEEIAEERERLSALGDAANQSDVAKLNAQWDEVSKKMTAIEAERAGLMSGILTESEVARMNELDRLWDEQMEGMSEDEKERAGQVRAANQEIVASYQTEFDRVSRITLASFNTYIAQGKTAVEATNELGPAIDELVASARHFGFEGSEAFNQLARWRELTTANQPLIDQVGSLNDLMMAMSNLGSLNVETFADLEAQGLSAYDRLIEAGFSEQEAMTQLAPMLETIRDLHIDKGLAIDDATKAMIIQAEADGLLAKRQMSTQDILKQGLGALIEVLGGKLPAAWVETADAATSEVWRIRGALTDLEGQLNTTDWTGWAEELGGAAEDAQYDIDGVSQGHSPGGIKDIPIHLALAEKAANRFARHVREQMAIAKQAVEDIPALDLADMSNSLASNPETQRALADMERMIATTKQEEQTLNLTVPITTEIGGKAIQHYVLEATLTGLEDNAGGGAVVSPRTRMRRVVLNNG